METAKIWQESNATLAPLQFFHIVDPDLRVNSLGPKFCSRPGLLDFGLSLVLDSTFKDTLSWSLFGSGIFDQKCGYRISQKM